MKLLVDELGIDYSVVSTRVAIFSGQYDPSWVYINHQWFIPVSSNSMTFKELVAHSMERIKSWF